MPGRGARPGAVRDRPALARLPGRFLFALDDGRGDVAAEEPDVCWRATCATSGALLVAGGRDRPRVASTDAVAVPCSTPREAFLTLRAADGGTAWRAAELPDAPARIAAALSAARPRAGRPPSRTRGAGSVALGPAAGSRPGARAAATTAGRALVVAAVLGELTCRPGPAARDDRPPRRRHARGALSCSLTLSSRSSSWPRLGCSCARPRRAVTACTGRPGCAKSLADVRTDARAARRRHLPDARMHWLAAAHGAAGLARAVHVDAVATAGRRLPASTASGRPRCVRVSRMIRELRPRRRGDLPAVVRHDPRRGRPVPAPGRRRPGGGADDPRVRHGRPRRRHRLHPRRRGRRAARRCADGAPILCDAEMVASGVTRARLPAGNEVVCTLRDPAVPGLAAGSATTRSAAALELWRRAARRCGGGDRQRSDGPVPPARDDRRRAHRARPRCSGIPVGFIGAAESKDALAARADLHVPGRPRPARRQRDHGGRGQRAREREE